MPQIKQASRFRRKAVFETLPFVAIMLAAFWYEDAFPESMRKPAVFAILMFSALAMVWVMVRRLWRFACPDCGKAIAHFMTTQGKPSAPIRYHCQGCDVIWETGLTTIDDD